MAPKKIKNKAPLFQKIKPPEAKVTPSATDILPRWFPKNPAHRFGTCWKCGIENEIPGGDYFKCSKDGWLPWKNQNVAEISGEPLLAVDSEHKEKFYDSIGDGARPSEVGGSSIEFTDMAKQLDNCVIQEEILVEEVEDDDDNVIIF